MKKQKIKIVYRNPIIDNEKKTREEIKKLEEEKKKNLNDVEKAKNKWGKIGKIITGIQYGIKRAGINNQINQRNQYLRGQQAIRNIKTKLEYEKSRSELQELQKKNMLSLEDLYGLNIKSNVKNVKFEDL